MSIVLFDVCVYVCVCERERERERGREGVRGVVPVLYQYSGEHSTQSVSYVAMLLVAHFV